MTGFDLPSGRVRALYGKTRGLVARRKALQAKVAPIYITIDDTDSESEQEKDKENQQPAFEVVIETKTAAKRGARNAVKKFDTKDLSNDESDDEKKVLDLPRLRRGAPKLLLEDESCEDLVSVMGRSLRITSGSKCPSSAERVRVEKNNLLKLCDQESASSFSSFLDELQSLEKCNHWNIVGEASFSEVFGLVNTGKVVKVIPLKGIQDCIETEGSVPDQSSIDDVHREIQLTGALAKVSPTFVKIHSSQILKGKYPARLLNARDRLAHTDSSSPTPEDFTAEQEYAALILADGGEDLESIQDLTWTQAASIFCQVVDALSHGEEFYQFEHRDLHWGNIVVTLMEELSLGTDEISFEQLRDPCQSGIKATIIDYTLSRATIGDTLIAYNFADEALFEGEGDMQYDVYRQMKAETKENWSGYHPHTNVLWLNYLASKLIDEKAIPNPKRRSRLDQRSNLELLSRNFIMEAKQVLLSKRFNSASDFNDHLATISLR